MKRFLLGFAACALITTSCSNNDVIENIADGQGQLSFSPGLGKQAATKAAELNNTDLQTAAKNNGIVLNAYQNVSGWKKWYNDEVVYDEGDGNWKLKTSVRFRNANPTKYITYFSQKGVDNLTNFDDLAVFTPGKFPKFTYTVAVNSSQQEDLIAGITEVAANKTDIILGMRHILSQINFGTVGYKGAQIQIQNINITGVKNVGDFTYRAANTYPIGDWTPTDDITNYDYYNNGGSKVPVDAIRGDKYIFGDGGNWGPGKTANIWYPVGTNGTWLQGNSASLPAKGMSNSLMLLPQDLEEGAKVTFEYKIQDVDNAYVAGSDTGWEKGEFKLNFSTGTTSGTHYNSKWEQNYRYVYLIDFTDFLDGIALTFKVDVEMYPWENYNKDSDDDGIVNIMAAGQPSADNMNAQTFVDGNTWYIASQSETDPTTFDPKKWAQVMRNETWNLSTYDFANIDATETFTLNFENVIFNTKEHPSSPSDPRLDTEIDLILPIGYTAAGGGEITVVANTAPRYTVNMKTGKTSGTITITNEINYNDPNTLLSKIEDIDNPETIYYKGTSAVDLTSMDNAKLTGVGNTIIIKFTSLVTPTVGATSNGLWTWNSATRTATWTKVAWADLNVTETAFTLASGVTTLYSSDVRVNLSDKFAAEPSELSKDALVTIVFKTAAARIMPTATYGAWTYYTTKNTAIYKRNDVLTLTSANAAFKAIAIDGQTIKCGDATVIDMKDQFDQPDDITNVTSATVIFSNAADRTFATPTADGAWTNPSGDKKTYVWTKTIIP